MIRYTMTTKLFAVLLVSGLLVSGFTGPLFAFTISISGNDGIVGQQVISSNGEQSGEQSFISDSGGTFYTDEESYSEGKSLEMNIQQGSTGFGSFGGIMEFPSYTEIGGERLVKGDEIWVRLRIKFPGDFEFNQNGRNKFLRLRTFSGTGVHEGYNDLYLNHPPGVSTWPPDDNGAANGPLQYIFEGEQQWYNMGDYSAGDQFPALGEWHTIEYYLRLDDQKGTEGGNSMVRAWLNGELLGETNARNTLSTPESYIESLYLFTFWDNDGAHKTQKLWVDDIIVTSDTPSDLDAQGNPFVGLGNIPELLGDFDEDGDTDGADFLRWQRDTSVGNLSDWQDNFGASSALEAASVVPEPSIVGLLMTLGLASVAGCRRRRVRTHR